MKVVYLLLGMLSGFFMGIGICFVIYGCIVNRWSKPFRYYITEFEDGRIRLTQQVPNLYPKDGPAKVYETDVKYKVEK